MKSFPPGLPVGRRYTYSGLQPILSPVTYSHSKNDMYPEPAASFLDDLLYFNPLVLWDAIPEQTSYELYESAWNDFSRFSPLEFVAERQRLIDQTDEILSRVNVLDIILPLQDNVSSGTVAAKPLATVTGAVPEIEGLRLLFDKKSSKTSVFIVVPPGVTDGKAFAAAVKRKEDGLHRYRKHQFDLYYRLDIRIRALDLVRLCRQTLPAFPAFKSVARFDRRVSDDGGRPRNWYCEVTRIGLAMSYFSTNRQNKSIGDLQDYMAEKNREPVSRNALGEDLKRTCRKWGISLWTGMGIESYKGAVGSVWDHMQGSADPLVQRAVDRFKSEQKEQRSKKTEVSEAEDKAA